MAIPGPWRSLSIVKAPAFYPSGASGQDRPYQRMVIGIGSA